MTPVERAAEAMADDWNPDRDPVLSAMFRDYAQSAFRSIDVDELAQVVDQAADDWDLGIGNGGKTWEHALARAVIAHLTKGDENDE